VLASDRRSDNKQADGVSRHPSPNHNNLNPIPNRERYTYPLVPKPYTNPNLPESAPHCVVVVSSSNVCLHEMPTQLTIWQMSKE